MSADLARRFGGINRLYGDDGAARLRAAHVCVVGIGGVGSWSAEALARSGVGQITLIDLDMVAESNTNRQIHAIEGMYGKAKVDAMAERISAINPQCQVTAIEDFVTLENAELLLNKDFSSVIDAIDQTRVKAAMIACCRQHKIPIIVAGAAGGKTDPTQIRIADLCHTFQDPLLAKVRSILRREYGYPRDGKKKFSVSSIFSTEALRNSPGNGSCEQAGKRTGLNCAGYGSSICVTSVFGMVAASCAIEHIQTQI